jgi:hypothetical protein
MKVVCVQLQHARSPNLNVASAVSRLAQVGQELGAQVHVTEGFDQGQYVNVNFEIEDAPALWAALRVELHGVPGLIGAAIVCCEGMRGWDDYLLLHHFDKAAPLDQLPQGLTDWER